MIKRGELRQHIILGEILYFIVDFYDYCDINYNFVTAFIFWKDSPLNGKIISGNINWFIEQTIPINNGTK